MRIAWLMSECVQNEIGKCLQNSKWKKPKKAEQVEQSMTFFIFAIPSSGVQCILSNLPFYFYLFWVWVLNQYPHYFSIKKNPYYFQSMFAPSNYGEKRKEKGWRLSHTNQHQTLGFHILFQLKKKIVAQILEYVCELFFSLIFCFQKQFSIFEIKKLVWQPKIDKKQKLFSKPNLWRKLKTCKRLFSISNF